MENEPQLRAVLPVNKQIIWRKLASFSVNTFGDDVLALIEVINLLKIDIGDDALKKHYGNKYGEKTKQLIQVECMIRGIKSYYDDLKRKRKVLEDTNSQKFKEFRKLMVKVPLFLDVVYEMFFVLIKQTTLINQSIPHEAFVQETQFEKAYSIDDKNEKN